MKSVNRYLLSVIGGSRSRTTPVHVPTQRSQWLFQILNWRHAEQSRSVNVARIQPSSPLRLTNDEETDAPLPVSSGKWERNQGITLAPGRFLSLILVLFLAGFIIQSSGCYSFTGASVPPHLKTIAIPLFDDQSGSGEPTLREQLTNKLQEIFRQDNNFQLADKRSSDALLEGVITSMPNEPSSIQKGESVSKNRITVNLKVTYRDQKFKKLIWEKQFSRYADYEISKGPSAKTAAITTAIEQLTEDILLDVVSGW